jgi:hypothetical protein
MVMFVFLFIFVNIENNPIKIKNIHNISNIELILYCGNTNKVSPNNISIIALKMICFFGFAILILMFFILF